MVKKFLMAGVGVLWAIASHAASEGEVAGEKYNKPGFVTIVEDGRLWVFAEGAKELKSFHEHGEPTVSVSKIGEGPEGMTLKSYSLEVLENYKAAK